MNIIKKFNIGLKKTSTFLSVNLKNVLLKNKIDQETLDDIESILLSSDIGIEVSSQLIKKIKLSKIYDPQNFDEILRILTDELESILKEREKLLITTEDYKPTVLLFIGVNGSGKTTTIGKLINKIPENKKILVVACDTFRAAAVEQLNYWTIKKNITFFKGKINQDPASVAYNACQKVKEKIYDYIIIDTAGRLSNNSNLLNQLIKIKSVIKKIINEKNIKTVLVLDGTNGSNMMNQVNTFNQSLNVSGLIITKLDGTAKGGALISIAKKYKIPINFVGLGENIEDLYEFNGKRFAKSMLGIDN